MLAPADLLDARETDHWALFDGLSWVWEALPRIGSYLEAHLKPGLHGKLRGQPWISESVYIGPGTTVGHGAVVEGPAWIGADCEIRPGAYIRANVIAGNRCVLGNSCEFKNCVLFNGCQVPHFSYVGDSILGAKAHLGAGVICSNLKLNGAEVTVAHAGTEYHTGLRKFGAVLGDRAEVGCNSVLNPGSILGRDSLVYPTTNWRGYLPARSIAKGPARPGVVARRD